MYVAADTSIPAPSPCRALPQDCLALGAIFATTDSVAVLQVLEQDRAPLLFSLVFGEGVINDATTVALLRTVQVGCCGLVGPALW